MTAERAQTIVGLSALGLVVLGPLSLALPVFFFTPLESTAWWSSLGLGLFVGLVPMAVLVAWSRKGLLDLPQVVVGGGLLLVGVMTLTCGVSLLLNGLLDRSEATRHRVQVERFWRDCSDHRAQNSTTTITTCRSYGSFSSPDGARRSFRNVELPDEAVLTEGELVEVAIRPGAFGWTWGLELD
ncbi:MAG: hypothetical protein AAGC60_27950 [Acidobacteriota bacterium]